MVTFGQLSGFTLILLGLNQHSFGHVHLLRISSADEQAQRSYKEGMIFELVAASALIPFAFGN